MERAEILKKWGRDVWQVKVVSGNGLEAIYLFETSDEAKEYINDKVGTFNHSELPTHIQQKYFKRYKRRLCQDENKMIEKTYDYDSSIDNYHSFSGYVEGNKITLDRSGTAFYFSMSGRYEYSKIFEYRAIQLISRGIALWLVKDHKSKSWLTC